MTYPTKKIGEVCDVFADGDWVETKDQSDRGIRLIQTGNVGRLNYIDKVGRARFITDKTFKRLNCTEIFPGDILISRLPDPVGRACILPKLGTRTITAVDCTIVRPNNKIIIDKFFLYFTESLDYYSQVNSKLSGTTRQRISRSNLAEIKISLPPLPIQKKIVKKIEELFGKINEAQKPREEEQKDADALVPAALHQIFEKGKEKGWEEKTLEEVTFIQSGFGFPKEFQGRENEKYPFLKVSDMNLPGNELYITNYNNSVSDVDIKSYKYRTAPIGTVIFPKIGGAIATNKKRILTQESIYDNNVMGLIPFSNINSKFLFYWLSVFNLSNWAAGSSLPAITQSRVSKTKILLPTIPEQKKIVAYLDSLSEKARKLQNLQKQTAEDLKALKQSILHKAFEGKLVK